jgi:hypothetical protein
MYRPSNKEILEVRNDIFLKFGLPALRKNAFEQSPFSNAWFGKDNCGDYSYYFCRLNRDGALVICNVYITQGDRWIKIKINIFFPQPTVQSLGDLKGCDGLRYGLPPNSRSEMRLRVDDRKCIPLFYLFGKEHKLGTYSSETN